MASALFVLAPGGPSRSGPPTPAGAAPMPTTASPGRQTRSWVAATPRTSVLHLGVGSSGSLPGPAAPVPARACGATPSPTPAPAPHPPGAGVGRSAYLTRPRRHQCGKRGHDDRGAGELARGAEVEGAAVDHQEQPQKEAEAG